MHNRGEPLKVRIYRRQNQIVYWLATSRLVAGNSSKQNCVPYCIRAYKTYMLLNHLSYYIYEVLTEASLISNIHNCLYIQNCAIQFTIFLLMDSISKLIQTLNANIGWVEIHIAVKVKPSKRLPRFVNTVKENNNYSILNSRCFCARFPLTT